MHEGIEKLIHYTEAYTFTRFAAKKRPISAFKFIIYFAGHERSLTQIKFNAEGDLLFTCSKDNVINVWFSHNGERLGTYAGNNGSVWTLDVDRTPSFFFRSLERF